jgi:hypothetical protein
MKTRNFAFADAAEECLVNKRTLAKAVQTSVRTVEKWVKLKKIPVVRISPHVVRFHIPSVIAALRRFEVLEAGR